MNEPVTAVVWDFDGTLLDTRQKNLNVTRALAEQVHGVSAERFPALRSLAEYERALARHRHWQQFYRVELGMDDRQVEQAGACWAQYQLADPTLAVPYRGIDQVLERIPVPQGIVSLNAADNIRRLIRAVHLERFFEEVVGYEQYAPDRQKPAPDALLACIARLTEGAPGTVVYIGDHEADAECVVNANEHLRRLDQPIRVLSISAQYAPFTDDSQWRTRAHYRAETPEQILEFLLPRLAGASA